MEFVLFLCLTQPPPRESPKYIASLQGNNKQKICRPQGPITNEWTLLKLSCLFLEEKRLSSTQTYNRKQTTKKMCSVFMNVFSNGSDPHLKNTMCLRWLCCAIFGSVSASINLVSRPWNNQQESANKTASKNTAEVRRNTNLRALLHMTEVHSRAAVSQLIFGCDVGK